VARVPLQGILSRVTSLLKGDLPQNFLPQPHQHHIHHQPVQPGAKSRLAAERRNLTEEVQERFLREVLGLGRVVGHPQTERIDPPLVGVKERLERLLVALLGTRDRQGFAVYGIIPTTGIGLGPDPQPASSA